MIRVCAAVPGPLDARLEAARRLELWGVSVDAPARLDMEHGQRIGRQCRDAGLHIAEVVCPRVLDCGSSSARAATVDDVVPVMQWAAAAGASTVRVATPNVGAAGAIGAALSDLADCCRDIVAAARPHSCRLLVLTEAGGPVGTLLGASEAVRRVGSGAFGVALDPVGLLTIDTYFDNGSFLTRAVQQLGAAIGLVRARDALMRARDFTSEILPSRLGEGGIDLAALLRALQSYPDVPVVIVADDAEALAADCARLRTIVERTGVGWGGSGGR